jgi:hypothetical protein
MSVQVQFRRGTNAQWMASNPVLADGEIALSTDTSVIKVGDGVSAWGDLAAVTLIPKFLSYAGLSSDVEILVGSVTGELSVLAGSTGSVKTVVQADSGESLGVQRAALSTSDLSGVNTSGATSGDLLRFDGSSWSPLTLGEMALASQRTFQNIALGHAGYVDVAMITALSRWSFPSDVVSTITFNTNGSSDAGFANPAVAGYLNQGYSTNIYKLAFPAETSSLTTSAILTSLWGGGFANPAVAGYMNQGQDYYYGASSTVQKWTFPADSVSITSSGPAAMYRNAGFANPAVAGYFNAGNNAVDVYKWTFPVDTVSTTISAPASMNFNAGFADPAVAGYFSRGANTTTVYKWAFPSDSVSATTSAPLSLERHGGFANPAVAGYFSKGLSFTSVYKWAFPTDIVVTTNSSPSDVGEGAGFANA